MNIMKSILLIMTAALSIEAIAAPSSTTMYDAIPPKGNEAYMTVYVNFEEQNFKAILEKDTHATRGTLYFLRGVEIASNNINNYGAKYHEGISNWNWVHLPFVIDHNNILRSGRLSEQPNVWHDGKVQRAFQITYDKIYGTY